MLSVSTESMNLTVPAQLAVVSLVIVTRFPAEPATVKLVITGFALSTCRVPVALATVPSPAVRVAVRSRSPSVSVAVSTSNA